MLTGRSSAITSMAISSAFLRLRWGRPDVSRSMVQLSSPMWKLTVGILKSRMKAAESTCWPVVAARGRGDDSAPPIDAPMHLSSKRQRLRRDMKNASIFISRQLPVMASCFPSAASGPRSYTWPRWWDKKLYDRARWQFCPGAPVLRSPGHRSRREKNRDIKAVVCHGISVKLNADLQRLSNHINIFQAEPVLKSTTLSVGSEFLLQQKFISSKEAAPSGEAEDASRLPSSEQPEKIVGQRQQWPSRRSA